MKTNKTSKRALLTSVLSIALCLSMLIGTTFAWFTDTASTAVNKIQAGTLDVDIVDADNNTLNGKTLYFRDVNGKTNILWEPGATFNLDTFRIVNKGNLALKYKVVISGIDGSAELLNVINFTVKKGDAAPVELAGWEGVLLPKGAEATGGADVETTGLIAISGKMDEQAGNQYQGLSIDGLGITVYATQSTYESDSNGNTYDEKANMRPDNLDKLIVANATATVKKDETTGEKADTTVATGDKKVTATVPAEAIAEDATDLTLTVTPQTSVPAGITVSSEQGAMPYDIKIEGIKADNETLIPVQLTIGKNLGNIEVYHITAKLGDTATADNAEYFSYDSASGVLTIYTKSFSPFTVVYSDGSESKPYQIFTADQALEMENGKTTASYKLMADIVVPDEIYLSGKKVTFDLNGHSIKLEYGEKAKPNNGSVLYIGGKGGSLTINDSSADQSGKVIGSDKTYTNKVTSAVRAGNYGKLTINGGHFYGTSEGTSCIFVYTSMSSGSKATVTINGGRFETATPSNGTYYVLNHQDNATAGCTITVNGGSFKNFNPGKTTVDPVNAKTGKIVLGAGCATTQNGEWYTVSK